jgi:penicillin V acylase-like amidase (Ntn superfamily)
LGAVCPGQLRNSCRGREAFRKEEFVIVTDFRPGTDKFATVHLSLFDASGDNAIFEYVNGKLIIYGEWQRIKIGSFIALKMC